MPVLVSISNFWWLYLIILEISKSMSFICRVTGLKRMFSGLISLWQTPWECKYTNVESRLLKIYATSVYFSTLFLSKWNLKFGDSQYSKIKWLIPILSFTNKLYAFIIFGWSKFFNIRNWVFIRFIKSWSFFLNTFTANFLLVFFYVASYTTDSAPSSILLPISYI